MVEAFLWGIVAAGTLLLGAIMKNQGLSPVMALSVAVAVMAGNCAFR